MKKTIITTITLLILFVGAYAGYVLYMNSQPITCSEGLRFNPATGECVLVNSLSSDSTKIDFENIIIKVPQSSAQILLTQNESGLFTGTYTDPATPNFEGFVSVDPSEVEYFEDNTIALAPFFLNSGGTGQFMYVALMDVANNTHLSSAFVEDRTLIKSIAMQGDKVFVNYSTRSSNQSFSEEPRIPAQLVLTIESDELTEYMRLENSAYDQIELKSPRPQSAVKGDFLVRGAVPGFWYFEAIAGYRIVDNSLREIAGGTVEARSDWMTERKVPFEFTLNTGSFAYTGDATLIIESHNIRGDEEGEMQIKKMLLPITIE